MSIVANAQTLSELHTLLESQADSLPLARASEDIVLGEGSHTAKILCIGEAPGYQETIERRPFVGRSGKLLRNVLAQVGITAEDIYITNIVKARPPDNRDPLAAEILAYAPFLDAEITLLKPQLIVTLGRFSMAKFLPSVKISQVHGCVHAVKWHNSVRYVLPMYHPAAALRSTKVRESFITDFGKIHKVIEWIAKQEENQQFSQTTLVTLF